MAQMTLALLRCGTCGKAVALGEGEVARCAACASPVGVPAEYLALRESMKRDAAARSRAHAVAEMLARPPSRLMVFWSAAGSVAGLGALLLLAAWLLVAVVMCIGELGSGGPIGALLMLGIGLVLGPSLLYDEALRGLTGPLQLDLADVLGGPLAHGLLGFSVLLLIVVPGLLAEYADSFETVRTALREALSARQGSLQGTADCRACGAPLSLAAGSPSVRCDYCGADNLLTFGAAHHARFKREVKVVCDDLEAAVEQQASAARAGRRRVGARLTHGLVLVPVSVLLGWAVTGVNGGADLFWRRAIPSSPMIPRASANPELERGRATRFDVRTFDFCDQTDCFADYYVALEAGESLHLKVADGEVRLVKLARRSVGPWYDPTYAWQTTSLEGGAPWSGWYRVTLATPKRSTSVPSVTWNVTP